VERTALLALVRQVEHLVAEALETVSDLPQLARGDGAVRPCHIIPGDVAVLVAVVQQARFLHA
jgi:hypothetical protein